MVNKEIQVFSRLQICVKMPSLPNPNKCTSLKKQIDTLDATPSKRLFQSIIADYDLNKAISELVDNALDIWTKGNRQKAIQIEISLDALRQLIVVKDNAGGIRREELSYIIAPGHTSNTNESSTIGIFGVGSKRAVVALAQDVHVKTSDNSGKKYQIDFDDSWLENQDNWHLPVYEIDDPIKSGTLIELHKLRTPLTSAKIDHLRDHLQATYAKFVIDKNVVILLNGKAIKPVTFDEWAYPPEFEPREYTGILHTTSGSKVQVHVLAGLTLESSGQEGEYGMYFYCNNRLIAKGVRNFDAGFSTGHVGKPHFTLSLARVIVSLTGEPTLMPWNSSKSGINTNHEVFLALQTWLIKIMKDYASLSKRFSGNWENQVFRYPEGEIVKVAVDNLPSANTSFLPPLPSSKPRYGEILKQKNKKAVDKRPWAKGAYETIIATDLILKQKLDQKNRIALMILDSQLEIAFKDYLVYESGTYYSDSQLLKIFGARHLVHQEVQKTLKLSKPSWNKINYYYKQRSELVHKRSSVSISDDDIEEFREVVQSTLSKMFKLKF
jgi:anti-sigma regulatory factor (Ser/Thr protein kinase)